MGNGTGSDTVGSAVNYIVDDTIWGLLEQRVQLDPNKVLLWDEHDRSVTFSEILQWAERVAAGLQAMGIGEGSHVSWQLPTKIETVVLSLALSRLGAVQNPIIHLYRKHEVGSLLAGTKATMFAVHGQWRGFDYEAMARELVEELAHPCQILVLEQGLPEGDPATLPPVSTDGDVIRWIYATSGTTSIPKAAMHTDKSLIAGGEGLGRGYAPSDDDIFSYFYPYAHIGGPDQLVILLEYGCSALMMEAFVPSEAVKLMQRYGVTQTGGSTAFYQAFVAEQLKDPSHKILPKLRFLAGGGAPKPADVYWQTLEVLGVPIYHGFAMTECPALSTCGVLDNDEQRANTDGLLVPKVEVEFRNDDGTLVEPGEVGEVWVRGPMVCKGYTDPVATAEAFDDRGFFHTGDRASMRADGRVVVSGRSKDMIIRKGENISPREIEDALMLHPDVNAVGVIGVPDVERGEKVCAVIELVPGAEPLTMATVQELCREAGLMKQKYPEQIEFMPSLPRNPTMKILKTELRALFG
ncbi:MAG: AMP-dependent synthetase and ligase [Acidimicrobiia bacterium]|nr:AMP-dependent synthetase and ligase [Acidimicrobiia bacterium]